MKTLLLAAAAMLIAAPVAAHEIWVEHDGKGVFSGLPTPLTCTRYHSLIVAERSLPKELEITARTSEANGAGKKGGTVIMGVRHRTLPVEGVQFHPESVLSEGGHQMIRNFLEM